VVARSGAVALIVDCRTDRGHLILIRGPADGLVRLSVAVAALVAVVALITVVPLIAAVVALITVVPLIAAVALVVTAAVAVIRRRTVAMVTGTARDAMAGRRIRDENRPAEEQQDGECEENLFDCPHGHPCEPRLRSEFTPPSASLTRGVLAAR
jgi:hypothetical protein